MINRRKVLDIIREEQRAMDGYSDPAWSALERVAEQVEAMDETAVTVGGSPLHVAPQ